MILRLAALALFAITLAAIQSTGVSQAITFPTMDLSCFAGCTGDPLQNSGDLQLLPGRQLKTEGAASAVATCADTAAPECVNRESGDRWGNTRQGEDYLDAMLSTENQVESKAFDVTIQIRDWDVSPGPHSCTTLGGQAHSPGEDCSKCRGRVRLHRGYQRSNCRHHSDTDSGSDSFCLGDAPLLWHLAAAKTRCCRKIWSCGALARAAPPGRARSAAT
jgi:hypothetical protein